MGERLGLERSEIELRLSEVVVPVAGFLNYIARTTNKEYTARQALDVHHNRWLLLAINCGYVLLGVYIAIVNR